MTRPGDAAPTDLHWFRIAVVGVLAGFTSGLFGVGGGIVMVPGLVLVAGFPQKLATGTSLSAIIPISVAGIAGYASDGEVDWVVAACVTCGAVVGALVGTRLLVRISAPLLQLLFAGAMLAGGAKLLFDEVDALGRGELTLTMAAGLLLLGVASGVLAGLLGVGGGIVIVPLLSIAFGVPHVLAKGTSLAVILPTAIMGTIRNRRTQLTALRPAMGVGMAGVISALLASQISLELDPSVSRALFAVLLVAAAVRLGHTGWVSLREEAGSVSDPPAAPDRTDDRQVG
ncbi:MAG TPA: sulfite exporter TauE/SafE family protein [Acidimicrobiales bacterium]